MKPEDQAERADALHEVAVELKGVADVLVGVRTKQDRNGWVLYGVFIEGVLLIMALVVIGILVQPILHTAKTVQDVAGPDAQAKQAQQSTAFVAAMLCNNRATTSESRVMDGKDPLPLLKGCPPYDFDPNRSIFPPTETTSTTTKARARAKRTTTTRATATTSDADKPPHATTTVTTTTTCPTVQVGSTCITIRKEGLDKPVVVAYREPRDQHHDPKVHRSTEARRDEVRCCRERQGARTVRQRDSGRGAPVRPRVLRRPDLLGM